MTGYTKQWAIEAIALDGLTPNSPAAEIYDSIADRLHDAVAPSSEGAEADVYMCATDLTMAVIA